MTWLYGFPNSTYRPTPPLVFQTKTASACTEVLDDCSSKFRAFEGFNGRFQ